jgi:hypothetical protein
MFVYSTKGGKHFIRIGNEKKGGVKFKWVDRMYATPRGDLLMSAVTDNGYYHVLISKDDGVTWEKYFDRDHSSGFYVSPKGTIFSWYGEIGDDKAERTKWVRHSKDMSRQSDLPLRPGVFIGLPSGRMLAYGYYNEQDKTPDFYKSNDDGLSWEKLAWNDEIIKLLEKNSDGMLLISEQKGKILKILSNTRNPAQDEYLMACQRMSTTALYCFSNPDGMYADIVAGWRKHYNINDRLFSRVYEGTKGLYFLINPKGLYRSVAKGESWEKPVTSSYIPFGTTGYYKLLLGSKQNGKIYLNWVEWPDI